MISKNVPLLDTSTAVVHGSFSGATSTSVPSSQDLCDLHNSGADNVTSVPDKLNIAVIVPSPPAPTVPSMDILHVTPAPTLVSSIMTSPVTVAANDEVIASPLANHAAGEISSAEADATKIALTANATSNSTPIDR